MATINKTNGSDTPNVGRVNFNNNDDALNDDISNVYSHLKDHKTSGDHDTRYDLSATVDSKVNAVNNNINNHKTSGDHDFKYVKLVGNENISGVKTFLSHPTVNGGQNTSMIRIITNPQDKPPGEVRISSGHYGSHSAAVLQLMHEDESLESLIWAGTGAIKDKFHISRDVYAKNKKLATEEYVQDRVKTGYYTFTVHGATLMLAQNTLFDILNSNIPVSFRVGQQSTLRKVSGSIQQGTVFQNFNLDCNYLFTKSEIDNPAGYNNIVPFIYCGLAQQGMADVIFKLYNARILLNSLQLGTEIFTEDDTDIALALNQPVIVKVTIYMSM